MAKDSIELFNDEFILEVKKEILPIYEQIAYSNKGDNEDRGKSIFLKGKLKDNELETIGNSFLRLVLESIFVWSKWFPVNPETKQISKFRITYEKCLVFKVKFPTVIYFKVDTIISNMPEEMVPKVMLRQMRANLKLDLYHQKLIKLTPEMSKSLKHKQKRQKVDDINEIYTDCFRRVIRRYRRIKGSFLKKNPKQQICFEDII